jgi:SAM-dependent methyltransferase
MLDRPEPRSDVFGLDRGTPIDRFHIERFLESHSDRIRGRALEIGAATYVRRYGAAERVDVLHAQEGNPEATFVGDLQQPTVLPPAAFDCIVLVQTLHVIADPAAAIRHCHAALAPGGCILATMPGISQISRYDMDRWGDYWRVTERGAQTLFGAVFSPEDLDVEAHGNAATACAFLQGLAAEELSAELLDARHPDYPLVVTIAATRP